MRLGSKGSPLALPFIKHFFGWNIPNKGVPFLRGPHLIKTIDPRTLPSPLAVLDRGPALHAPSNPRVPLSHFFTNFDLEEILGFNSSRVLFRRRGRGVFKKKATLDRANSPPITSVSV
jgi:hypothetical protein